MQEPLLSVIMPVYNAETYLEDTLSSLLTQSFREFELICINDCSRDNSIQILQAYAEKDSRIRCIDLEHNVGAGEARNYGIAAAQGVYLTFLDADDSIEPDLYERAMARTEGHTIDMVVWGAVEEHFNERNSHVKSVSIVPTENRCQGTADIVSTSLLLEEQTLFGYLWNTLYRGDIVRNNALRIRNALFYEDYFFNLDFVRHAKSMAVMPYPGYHYFKRVNSSVTHSFTKDYFDLSYERVESFYRYCAENDCLTDRAIEILGNKLLRYTLSALARNNDPKSGMDNAERRLWIEAQLSRPLYRDLLCSRFPTNMIFRILRLLINRHQTSLLLLAGKTVYVFKK